jgi:hypothetical protein
MVKKHSPISQPISSPEGTRTDGNGNALHSRLLLGLPAKDCDFLFSKLVFLNFRLHDVLQEVGNPIQYCYFPNTAMASILNVMNDGKSVEVGLAGWEGFVGMPLVVGFRSSSSKAVIQAEGTAFRVNADDMRQALPKCPQLMMNLVRYSQGAAMEVTQIAACNRLHDVEKHWRDGS